MRNDSEGGRISDHSSLESGSVRSDLARLHRSHVHSEGTLLDRLTGVLDSDDVESRLDGLVSASVVLIGLAQSVLLRRTSRTHDHDPRFTVTTTGSLGEDVEETFFTDTVSLRLNTTTSRVALACIHR